MRVVIRQCYVYEITIHTKFLYAWVGYLCKLSNVGTPLATSVTALKFAFYNLPTWTLWLHFARYLLGCFYKREYFHRLRAIISLNKSKYCTWYDAYASKKSYSILQCWISKEDAVLNILYRQNIKPAPLRANRRSHSDASTTLAAALSMWEGEPSAW